MTIASLPTRNPADLGAALFDARTPNANELAAANIEKIKDRIIEVATEVGLSNGLTSGSINEMRAAFTSGAYSSILRRIGSSYGSQRIGASLGAPGVSDDSAQGYAPGSWWVQATGIDNPATLTFWICADATAGAAVWVQIYPTAAASGRRTVDTIAIANGVTLATGDAVSFVSGRATKSDARAGTADVGYIGQCLVGGTGDAGGTVFAQVVTSGTAPATGLTAGLAVYRSTATLGALTTAEPGGLGVVLQRVGLAISATEFEVQIERPTVIDWCSPLDIPTNGIFYGRASSANLLASGRITTNGIACLFGSGRFATVDGAGSAPAFVPGGGPGSDAWFFVRTSRQDRLRIVHDAGMSGVAWSVLTVDLNLSASFASRVAKTSGTTPEPFDFGCAGAATSTLASEPTGIVSTSIWRADSFSREGASLPVNIWSRAGNIATSTGAALSAGTNDITIGNRQGLDNGMDGRIAAVAIWNRALTAAEHLGLARWARREWAL